MAKLNFGGNNRFLSLMFIIFIIISCSAFLLSRYELEKVPRQKIAGSSVIYVPSGKYLKLAAFGYNSLAADLIYIWAIQYYSNTGIAERFNYLDHIFSVISELDPHYLDPYQIGALIAIYDARDFELALQLLDRGLIHNPKEWILPFEAGHYAQLVIKDYRLARHYYQKTMEIEGAPAIAKRLYANAAFMTADYETAWKTWLEVYQEAEDERIKKIASNHLYQVKAALDIKNIQEAIDRFTEIYGRKPAELQELVSAGLLNSLPKDFDGQDYVYNPKKGEVKPSIIPWKR